MIDSTLANRMTMPPETAPPRRFALSILPWAVAAAFLVIYGLTLNPWLSLGGSSSPPYSSNSLEEAAKIGSSTLQFDATEPVYWLLTYPIRLLPKAIIPLALNWFSAVCAVLTLALLARSVALLPHDRTEEQRAREKNPLSLLSIPTAWLPPLLAVLVCGLQLTFWENATAGSAEMLNLLMFAYVIRSLLEYRVDGRQRWLSSAAFVFGAAMAGNWAMLGFFPIFIVALVWVRGLGFFNLRFLSRMAMWGSMGLLFYLLLPLVNGLSPNGVGSFWDLLKLNLATQKGVVFVFLNKGALFNGERPFWVLALPSLLPLLVMSIRWPSYFGDPSRLGVTLATLIFHLVHALLFVVCAWVALDPKFSPRYILDGNPAPMLTLYYLGALAVGYFCGYFLLVFGVKPNVRSRTALNYFRPVSLAALAVTWVLAILVPAGLVHRNLPQIRVTNSNMLKDYAAFSADALPQQAGIIMSDDDRRLTMMDYELARRNRSKDFKLIDTRWMQAPEYHRFLKRKYKSWPVTLPKEFNRMIEQTDLMRIVSALARSNSIYYLHPSFGYYYEVLQAEPHGLVYRLQPYGEQPFTTPLTEPLIAENQGIWDRIDQKAFASLQTATTPPNNSRSAGFADRMLERAHLRNYANRDASMLGKFYSRGLVAWGTQLQRAGKLGEAKARFDDALRVNPENLVAQINLQCNRQLKNGEPAKIELTKNIEDQFGRYRTWDQIISDNGPYDEPTFCFEQGKAFWSGKNFRQGAIEFRRVKELAPENLVARLYLCTFYNMDDSRRALQEVGEIHANEQQLGVNQTNASMVLYVELAAYLRLKDLQGADGALDKVLKQYPDNEDLLATASQVFLSAGANTNALRVFDKQLKIDPNNKQALANKGVALLRMGDYPGATTASTRALELEPDKTSDLYKNALFNRAVAELSAGNLDAARQDYSKLQQEIPTGFQFAYGLGEIAYKQNQTNEAIRNYELFLQSAPANIVEGNSVRKRLAELYEAEAKTAGGTNRNPKKLKELYEAILANTATNSPEAATISNRLAQLKRGS